jgi:hypothetical protein
MNRWRTRPTKNQDIWRSLICLRRLRKPALFQDIPILGESRRLSPCPQFILQSRSLICKGKTFASARRGRDRTDDDLSNLIQTICKHHVFVKWKSGEYSLLRGSYFAAVLKRFSATTLLKINSPPNQKRRVAGSPRKTMPTMAVKITSLDMNMPPSQPRQ